MFQIFLGYSNEVIHISSPEEQMSKIGITRLKQIVREELKNLHEGADHDTVAKVTDAAAKLLGAIESFKEKASEKAKAEMGSSLDSIEQILDRISKSPMQYVDSTEPGPKVVTLKPEKKEVV